MSVNDSHTLLRLAASFPLRKGLNSVGSVFFPPFFITIKLNHRCNLRCQTCNSWKMNEFNPLSEEELGKMCSGIGYRPLKITLTGGEPFLHKSIGDFLEMVVSVSRPGILVVATNGWFTERIVESAQRLSALTVSSEVVFNISVDGSEEMHDFCRGRAGSFQRAMETFRMLRGIPCEKIKVGFNITISKCNIDGLAQTCSMLTEMNPDHILMEPAAVRTELNNAGFAESFLVEDPNKAVMEGAGILFRRGMSGRNLLQRMIRQDYYKRIINGHVSGRCHAGMASVQITPEGEVWTCPVKPVVMGNLRNFDFDLISLLRSNAAKDAAVKVKSCREDCMLADAYYFNLPYNMTAFAGRTAVAAFERAVRKMKEL